MIEYFTMRKRLFLVFAMTALTAFECRAQDQPENTQSKQARIFSGPQVGEKLSPVIVRGVFDSDAGKEMDFVKQADGKPVVLVFVHEANRPSISMTRALTTYTVGRAKDGIVTGVVWLTDDATEAENRLKQMRHALTPGAPTGISLDGKEGPGSYGLNRNVTLTILVGKDSRVTANFALVQPSLQADLPKILQEIIRVAGGSMPKIEELVGNREMVNLRGLIQPVIQLNAKPEVVEQAAMAVEEAAKNDDGVRKEIGRVANTIVDSGKLSTYGTPRAQEFLRKWAKEYGKPPTEKPGDRENKK